MENQLIPRVTDSDRMSGSVSFNFMSSVAGYIFFTEIRANTQSGYPSLVYPSGSSMGNSDIRKRKLSPSILTLLRM